MYFIICLYTGNKICQAKHITCIINFYDLEVYILIRSYGDFNIIANCFIIYLIHLLQALKEEIKDMHGLRITTGVPG